LISSLDAERSVVVLKDKDKKGRAHSHKQKAECTFAELNDLQLYSDSTVRIIRAGLSLSWTATLPSFKPKSSLSHTVY